MAEEKLKRLKALTPLQIGLIVLVIALLAFSGWSYYNYMQAKKQLATLSTLDGQQQLAQKEVDTLLTQIKKHMVLPDKERPTVATVTDVNALKKNQPFFAKAENGDKVLVYVQERKAIIYSPKKDLIVNVGFVAVDNNGQANANTQAPITLEVRNGTETSGLGQRVAATLREAGANVQRVADARRKDYSQTVVVDLGKVTDKTNINAVAQLLNAEVVTAIPEGESNSTADAIVIVGTTQPPQ